MLRTNIYGKLVRTKEQDELKELWGKKFPTWFWGSIPFTNIKWEILFFYKLRQFKDGVSFFEFKINLDLYDPLEYVKFYYKPSFNIHLVVFNYTVFDLSIYKVVNVN